MTENFGLKIGFRVENGKIAEHWDVMEPLMEKEKWANTNGKF